MNIGRQDAVSVPSVGPIRGAGEVLPVTCVAWVRLTLILKEARGNWNR